MGVPELLTFENSTTTIIKIYSSCAFLIHFTIHALYQEVSLSFGALAIS